MLELYQHEIPHNALHGTFNKMGEIRISINKELIDKDINRLKEYKLNTKSKYDKNNINALIKYLEKFKESLCNKSHFDMCWGEKNGLPSAYPIKFIKEKAYGIDMCNYIETSDNEKIVEVDIKELADIIAFEFMSRDLGETHESIEELLKDCSIVGFEDSKLLSNYFKNIGDDMYELSRTMKIGETPYKSINKQRIKDYFNSIWLNTNEYREIVDYSCRYANTALANLIMKRILHLNEEVQIISLSATRIVFIYAGNSDIKQRFDEEVSIRVFGRRFVVKPTISVY